MHWFTHWIHLRIHSAQCANTIRTPTCGDGWAAIVHFAWGASYVCEWGLSQAPSIKNHGWTPIQTAISLWTILEKSPRSEIRGDLPPASQRGTDSWPQNRYESRNTQVWNTQVWSWGDMASWHHILSNRSYSCIHVRIEWQVVFTYCTMHQMLWKLHIYATTHVAHRIMWHNASLRGIIKTTRSPIHREHRRCSWLTRRSIPSFTMPLTPRHKICIYETSDWWVPRKIRKILFFLSDQRKLAQSKRSWWQHSKFHNATYATTQNMHWWVRSGWCKPLFLVNYS